MADEAWMNGEPLAVAVERLRQWGNQPGTYYGNEWRPNPQGDTARVLRYVPDPVNAPWDQWQVDGGVDGQIWLTNAYNSDEWRVMHQDNFEGRRGLEHWPFVDESVSDRKRAGAAALAKVLEALQKVAQ